MSRRGKTLLTLFVLLAIAAAIAVPKIMHLREQSRLIAAIDEMQPQSVTTIKELVARGHDLRTRGSQNATVAMVAAYWNDVPLLRAALEAGVDPNAAETPYGNTALIFATFAPSPEPTRLLLAAGANPNHQTQSGETALLSAVRNAQYDLVQLLLAAGARVDVKNNQGETPLALAQALRPTGRFPLRPDLTPQHFVRLLEAAKK